MAKEVSDYQFRILTADEAAIESRLRMAITGISGGGKTYSALRVAFGICDEIQKNLNRPAKVAVIDSENKTSAKYKRDFNRRGYDFQVIPMGEQDPITRKRDYSPNAYIAAILFAEKMGIDVCIIDSLSHAWFGENGELEQVNMKALASKSGNTYYAWRDVTPLHNKLVDTMIQSPMHIIVTMRSKSAYVEEKRGDKTTYKKTGMEPIMRDGLEYEMDICLDCDIDHNAIVTKTRCSLIDGEVYRPIDETLGKVLANWVSGKPDPRFAELPADRLAYVRTLAEKLGPEALKGVDMAISTRRIPGSSNILTPETLEADLIRRIETKVEALGLKESKVDVTPKKEEVPTEQKQEDKKDDKKEERKKQRGKDKEETADAAQTESVPV